MKDLSLIYIKKKVKLVTEFVMLSLFDIVPPYVLDEQKYYGF